MTTYRIREWDVFENPTRDKRPKKGMEWYHHTTTLTSRGRLRLLREGTDGVWALEVFNALCCLHGQRPIDRRNGVLVNSDGTPLDLDDVSDSIHISVEIIRKSLALLSSERIGWLEVVAEEAAEPTKHGPNTDQIGSVSGPEPVLRGEEKREEKRECPNGHSPRMGPLVADCPYDEIAAAYREALVPPLPALRDGIPKAIREDVKRRWREHPDLAVFRETFARVRDSDFLMGRVGDWQVPGLGWIVGPKNWAKIQADNYRNRDRPTPSRPSRLHEEFMDAERRDAERIDHEPAPDLRSSERPGDPGRVVDVSTSGVRCA